MAIVAAAMQLLLVLLGEDEDDDDDEMGIGEGGLMSAVSVVAGCW